MVPLVSSLVTIQFIGCFSSSDGEYSTYVRETSYDWKIAEEELGGDITYRFGPLRSATANSDSLICKKSIAQLYI